MKFHSPYQFIALKPAPEESKTDYANREALKNNHYARHDRWHESGLSGSIHCTLTTESPLVVGAKQESGTEETPGYVRQYKHPDKTIAIPANSLRGMIANIAETLSQSSLRVLGTEWCKKLEKSGSFFSAVERTADKDVLPWSKNRNELTSAESLFGVVEEDFNEQHGARNLASRLQFTDATPVDGETIELEKCITLKILDSPKPPSPAMYFNSGGKNHLSKADLDLNKHTPMGRKHYLPQPKAIEKNSWQTKTPKNTKDKSWKQHLSCRPIPTNRHFKFTLHFENLSPAELGLLRTALSPAREGGKFHHRLGLGKPLGLGQVTLSIDKIKTIDRVNRYCLEGLQQSRYKNFEQPEDTSFIDQESLEALLTLYNPDNIKYPVCYPFMEQEAYAEEKGFEWFGENEKQGNKKRQGLTPVVAGEEIPTLSSHTRKKATR